MCSGDANTAFERKYPVGVRYFKTLPYVVAEDCEVYHILSSLRNAGDLSLIPSDKVGEFTCRVAKNFERLGNPFEAFVCAFYDGWSEANIPGVLSSKETAAWTMAENAYYYDMYVRGVKSYDSCRGTVYDKAITWLSCEWVTGCDAWKAVVMAFWRLESDTSNIKVSN